MKYIESEELVKDNQMQLLRLIPLLQQVLARADIQRTRTGGSLNITTLQTTALGVVYRQNNLTMSELARELLLIQSAATRIADELVKRGLVKRVNDNHDRRVTRLRITLKGKETIESLRQESSFLLSLVMQKMSGEEQNKLIEGLRSFLDAIQSVEREVISKCEDPECEEIKEEVKKTTPVSKSRV